MAKRTPVLVTGAAGYIGSHVALALCEGEYELFTLDNLSRRSKRYMPKGFAFARYDIAQKEVRDFISHYAIKDVIHLAGMVDVEESMRNPDLYFSENLDKTRAFAEMCVLAGVERFVFSSTAAVYGSKVQMPVSEDAHPEPDSPYGESKLRAEQALREIAKRSGMKLLIFRYFNVVGIDRDRRVGYELRREKLPTHLVPRLALAALGEIDTFRLFGQDYDTLDGTPLRDLIHVSDVASAHVKALEYLRGEPKYDTCNLGYGHSHSVKEIHEVMEQVAGKKIPVEYAPRRPGDLEAVFADVTRLKGEMSPVFEFEGNLERMLESEYVWLRRQTILLGSNKNL